MNIVSLYLFLLFVSLFLVFVANFFVTLGAVVSLGQKHPWRPRGGQSGWD